MCKTHLNSQDNSSNDLNKFESLLGPSILPRGLASSLPSYYFESISNIQVWAMSYYIKRLPLLLSERRMLVDRVVEPLFASSLRLGPLASAFCDRRHVYWQYVFPVTRVSSARKILFDHGVETSTTNLPDLALSCGVNLCNASKLKQHFLYTQIMQLIIHKVVENFIMI